MVPILGEDLLNVEKMMQEQIPNHEGKVILQGIMNQQPSHSSDLVWTA